MYTNYPNTEQITQTNDPKGSTQHLGELCFSLLAEVLQVGDNDMKSSFPKRYKSILIVFMKMTFFYLDPYILLIFNVSC